MNPNCERARDLLLEAGTLDAPARAWLDGHLGACAACREEAGLIRCLNDFMEETRPPLPADFADRVLAAVHADRQAPRRAPAGWLAAAAALTATLLLAQPGVWGQAARVWRAAGEGLAAGGRAVAEWLGEQGSGLLSFPAREWLPAVTLNSSLAVAAALLLGAAGLLVLHHIHREVR